MESKVLDVQLVEGIQRALERGRPLRALEQVQIATLDGLLEYACLRYSFPGILPVCPGTLSSTSLAMALAQCPAPLGMGAADVIRSVSRDIAVRPVEFKALPSTSEMASDTDWECFLTRFERSTIACGFSPQKAALLQSAFSEMCDNAALHAESPATPLAGYTTNNGCAQFAVIDVGMGIRKSLARNPLYSDIPDDVSAIEMAVRTGVTRHVMGSGGFGFHSVFKALVAEWGTIRFRSGNGCLSMDGLEIQTDHCRRSYPPVLPGFQVSVHCRVYGHS